MASCKLRESVKDRETRRATVHGVAESDTAERLTTIILIPPLEMTLLYMSVLVFFNFGFCLFACLFFNRQCGVGEREKNKDTTVYDTA